MSSLESEFRRCPITGRWVIVAPVRATRPLTLSDAAPHIRTGNHAAECPFCEGREAETPRELFAIRTPGSVPDGPGWTLRVCPNKYPAVTSSGEWRGIRDEKSESIPGVGEHELIIECARHEANPANLSDAEFRDVLLAYRQRIETHARDSRLAYSIVFKNVGAEAGASLAHLHSQILATPIVPESVRVELEAGQEHHRRSGHCIYCDLFQRERTERTRIIAETETFTAFAPYAPRFAYEFWVLPNRHASHYETTTDAELLELSRLLKRLFRALDVAQHEPAYNYFLHTAPLRTNPLPHFHWHLEVLPRTSRPAGFEWGTGCSITAVSPEDAAAELRNQLACGGGV